MEFSASTSVDISVIIPVKNGGEFFAECLESLLVQQFLGVWEISVFDDGSTDETPQLIEEFSKKFYKIGVNILYNHGSVSKGVGFAKNKAVEVSTGRYLCFCDADDINYPSRLQDQFDATKTLLNSAKNPFTLVGSQFVRDPENSTERYSRWANSLNKDQILQQVYTSHGPTVIMPTWFMSRKLFERLSGFSEVSKGFPEDLEFFYRALDVGTAIFKVEKPLITYRYHPNCASFGVSEQIIWNMRVKRLQTCVLPLWATFTIWNAGKQGKQLFKSLSKEEQDKVTAFCDVDLKKIRRGVYEIFNDVERKVTHRIPIIAVSEAVPPVVICVKLDMTGGDLEQLISISNWKEGRNYILFS